MPKMIKKKLLCLPLYLCKGSYFKQRRNVPSDWFYCSAGFAKFPFEVILEKELSVKVLSSALDGDGLCRFEIDLG